MVKTDEIKRQLVRQREINQAFGNMYFAIYSVDLLNDRYLEISTLDIFREHIPPEGANHVLLDAVVKYYVSKGYQEGMARFLDMRTLQDRMGLQKAISHEFHGTTQGWCRASFVVEKRAETGKVERVVYVTQEINQERLSESEKQRALKEAYAAANLANQAKSDFLSKMSHDIRTPMNAIIGMTEIAMAHLGDRERVTDCLSKIAVSSSYLLGLINEVLDMSKIESGTVSLNEERFNLDDLGDTLLDIAKPMAAGKKQKIEARKSLVHTEVYGDRTRLQQALINILSNAVKYTPEGGKISISIEELPGTAPQMGSYRFVCEDNGIGMSPEYVKDIFEPFSREKDTRVAHIQGTGLGMTITKNAINMMGGTIVVKSRQNEGSVFTVTVRLKLAGEEEEPGAQQAGGADECLKELDYSGKRALLAEDNELNREIACEILAMTGISVESAANGREAVELFENAASGYYDIVLMDVQMPLMNGYEATRVIRSLDREDAGKVPIIAMTANAFAEDVESAVRAGMNEHLAKPVNIRKLKEVLERWVK